MADASSANDTDTAHAKTKDKVQTIEKYLAKLEYEEDSELQKLYITQLTTDFKKLADAPVNVVKKTSRDKRVNYFRNIQERCQQQMSRITLADWVDFKEALDRLRMALCMDFTRKPLSFTCHALDYMKKIEACETEVLRMIETIRSETGTENIFQKHYKRLTERRKKIVIACIGTLKSTKSSFVNYLLDAAICPIGMGRVTARLTKIVFGEKIIVTLMSKDGQPKSSKTLNDEASIERYVRPLVKLEGDERSSALCQDYVVIELNREELRSVELWDIPGFDENPELDKTIGKILVDADLVFALTPLNDDVRSSFVKLINTALQFSNNASDRTGLSTINSGSAARSHNFFIVATKADIIVKDSAANVTVDEALQELRTHVYEQFPNWKTQKDDHFIPMCTNHSFDLSTYLHCYQQFLQKSDTFFRSGFQNAATIRLQNLMEIVREVFDYYDIDRAIKRTERIESQIQIELIKFEKNLFDELHLLFENLENAVLAKVETIIKKKTVFHSDEFEENLLIEATDSYNCELVSKTNEVDLCIKRLFKKFLDSIYLNPQLSEAIQESIRRATISNPFEVPSGQLSSVSWYLTAKEDLFGWDFIRENWKAGISNLLFHKEAYRERVAIEIRGNIRGSIRKLTQEKRSELSKLIMNQLKSLTHRIGKKKIMLTYARENESARHVLQTLNKKSIYDLVMRTFLMIQNVDFLIQYPHCTINTSAVLDTSNCSVYAAQLISYNRKIDIPAVAKRVSGEIFSMQETRYIGALDHPNLMKVYGLCKCEDPHNHYDIFMERLDCNLSEYLKNSSEKNKIGEEILDYIIQQIVEGLNYLHKLDLIHRDIKPPNILLKLRKGQRPQVRIGDFGFIHRFPVSLKGTEGYIDPELLPARATDQVLLMGIQSDIYALGVTIQAILETPHRQDTGKLNQFWLRMTVRCRAKTFHERPRCETILDERAQLNILT